jgi:hypothetical protein
MFDLGCKQQEAGTGRRKRKAEEKEGGKGSWKRKAEQ